jgi:hypothetical protein
MKMMTEHTLHIGLIILMLAMFLVILLYMVSGEVDMAEHCKEPLTSSTKICNGGSI